MELFVLTLNFPFQLTGGAGSNLVAKALMQRLPTASIVLKLLSDDFLHARSSKVFFKNLLLNDKLTISFFNFL